MENIIKAENPEINKLQILENADLPHWLKEYDITAEDLKNKEQNVAIYDAIIKSHRKKAN